MPESPDFEKIAHAVMAACHDEPVPWRIADALRSAWTARGTADATVVTLKLHELIGTASGGVYAEHVVKALKELDR